MEKSQYSIMYEVEESHFWYVGMQKIIELFLARYLPKKPARKILDAGCGTGGMLLFLKKYGEAYGIDISSYAISLCKKRGLANMTVGSVEKLPYLSGFFDVVTCLDVLYHRQVKNDEKTLREIYRVLRPGGLLLIRVPAYNWLRGRHDQKVHTRHRYTAHELKTLLQRVNFQVLRLTYVNSVLFPLLMLKRLTEKFFLFKNQSQSDISTFPVILNWLLKGIFWCEGQLLKCVSFPFGLSIMTVAQKDR